MTIPLIRPPELDHPDLKQFKDMALEDVWLAIHTIVDDDMASFQAILEMSPGVVTTPCCESMIRPSDGGILKQPHGRHKASTKTQVPGFRRDDKLTLQNRFLSRDQRNGHKEPKGTPLYEPAKGLTAHVPALSHAIRDIRQRDRHCRRQRRLGIDDGLCVGRC